MGVETLESRLNPGLYYGLYYWDPIPGGNPVATTPENWVKLDQYSGSLVRCDSGDDPADDEGGTLEFGAWIPDTYYEEGDPNDPYPEYTLIPAHLADADCILSQPDAGSGEAQFYQIDLFEAYTHQIDLRQSLALDRLTVAGGEIKQNDQATVGSGDAGAIDVATGFVWTGGTINSNTVAGELNLKAGATGCLIAPKDEGMVNLGSTLTLCPAATVGSSVIGASLEIDPGTVNLNAGNGFVVQAGSMILFVGGAPVPQSTTVIKINDLRESPNADGQLKVESGAEAVVQREARRLGYTGPVSVEFEGKLPKFTNEGKVTFKSGAAVKFTVTEGLGTNGGYVQEFNANPSPVTRIEAGCSITCTKDTKVYIANGTFELAESRVDGVPVAAQDDILIKAATAAPIALELCVNTTLKRADADPKVPLRLKIEGGQKSLDCMGTIELYAKRGEDKSDLIEASSRVKLWPIGAKIKMLWFDPGEELRGVGAEWTLITSGYLGAQDAIEDGSTFDPPDQDNTYAASVDPILKNKLNVKRTT